MLTLEIYPAAYTGFKGEMFSPIREETPYYKLSQHGTVFPANTIV